MKVKSLVSAVVALGLLTVPTLAFAQGFDTVLSPFEGVQGGSDVVGAIRNIVNALLVLIAIIAVIFVIIGGVRYITSSGDEDASAAAKNTILYALVGLVIIGLSIVLVNFILAAVSS
jgi:uncharacterized membrane protein YidH (DUF202 family)